MNIFIKYINVGILNSVLGLAVIMFCFNILNINYNISYFTGYFIGFINSFVLNKRYTFQSDEHWKKEIVPFSVVFIISYGFSNLVLFLLVEMVHLNKNIAIIVSMGVYTIVGFLLNKKVFKGSADIQNPN